jgi:nickel-dependent lactate racemase
MSERIPMKITLQYGADGLSVDLPHPNVTLIEPKYVPGLPDEAAAFRDAVRNPIESPPLKQLIRSADRVAVLIPDITRPLPSERILPWLFAELSHVPAENFVIINGTGSHRANTPAELQTMLGRDIVARYRVVNHDAHDPATMTVAGQWPDGQPLRFNAEYLAADKRILVGFIEPHFMAGFSGGYKAAFPGVADIDSILRYHGPTILNDPRTTWGLLEGNPTQAIVRQMGSQAPVDFLVNLTLNRDRRITGWFCGAVIAAHERGAAFSRSTVMVPVEKPFPIVVTTNSGYPLDQNLYQSVKGMHAAALICAEGGLIVEAARCNDGFPAHGNFRKLLFDHHSPQALLDTVLAPGFLMFDQWEAQMLANVLLKARVALYSELPADEVRRAWLEPITDVATRVAEELDRLGDPHAPIAVLPEGPMTVPYLSNETA